MNTKNIAKTSAIKKQIEVLKETKLAYQALLAGVEKQEAALDELLEAFEMEDATPNEIRARAMAHPKK
jgi:hypothetical protein